MINFYSMKNIAIVYGGYSSEIEISIKSGKSVVSWLDKSKYNVYKVLLTQEDWIIDEDYGGSINKSDFSFVKDGEIIRFDKVIIMIHGAPGENGILQAYFEMIGVSYIGCSSRTSMFIFDKYACKSYLKDLDIPMADHIFLRKGMAYSAENIVEKLGLPIFVKAVDGGSSFGVTKVKQIEDIDEAIRIAYNEGDSLIIENAIIGTEVDCAVYSNNGVTTALPPIEIVPHTEFFDYEAKYLGASDEICPARISKLANERIQNVSKKIFDYFGCTGLVRMDFIIKDDIPYFLEVNPIPGMTNESLVPQEVRAAGMNMTEFWDILIN